MTMNVLGSVALALVFHQSQSTLDHLQGQGRLCEQDQPPLSLDTIAITLMHINPNLDKPLQIHILQFGGRGVHCQPFWTITRKLSNLDYIIYDVQWIDPLRQTMLTLRSLSSLFVMEESGKGWFSHGGDGVGEEAVKKGL